MKKVSLVLRKCHGETSKHEWTVTEVDLPRVHATIELWTRPGISKIVTLTIEDVK